MSRKGKLMFKSSKPSWRELCVPDESNWQQLKDAFNYKVKYSKKYVIYAVIANLLSFAVTVGIFLTLDHFFGRFLALYYYAITICFMPIRIWSVVVFFFIIVIGAWSLIPLL